MSKIRTLRVLSFVAVAWFAVQGTPGGAQTPGEEPQAPLSPEAVVVTMTPGHPGVDVALPSGFGIADEHISVVGWASFRPYISSAVYTSDVNLGGRWNTSGSSFLYAPLPDDIPNGADITQVAFYVEDSSATVDFTGRLCRYYTESNAGGTPGSDCPFSVSTSGSPGNIGIGGDPNVTMMRRVDLTGDGPIEVINWVLHHNQGTALDGSIKIRQARILWRRQVSPAPVTATFLDVPTTHPYFKFVEALAASGITGGCGSGNYCPDSPLTRGEMAVFLAAALGLHWPVF